MSTTIQTLIDSQQGCTDLHWIAGQEGHGRLLRDPDTHASEQIGYMNLIHPERISVLGPRELAYYRHLDEPRRQRLHDTLLAAQPPALIISNGLEAPTELVDFCNRHHLPLLRSALTAGPLLDTLEDALTL